MSCPGFHEGDSRASSIRDRAGVALGNGEVDAQRRRFRDSKERPALACAAGGDEYVVTDVARGHDARKWRDDFVERLRFFEPLYVFLRGIEVDPASVESGSFLIELLG